MSTFKVNDTSQKDFLFILIIGLAALFYLAFLLMNPPTKKHDAPKKAELMLVISWNGNVSDDIDLWVQMPHEKVLSYKTPRIEAVHLEKDDQGTKSDFVKDGDGNISFVPINREVVTYRGVAEGHYSAAIHVYRYLDAVLTDNRITFENLTPSQRQAMNEVEFTLIDLNPTYKEVFRRKVTYQRWGQEVHLANWTVTPDGTITDVNISPQSFVLRERDKLLGASAYYYNGAATAGAGTYTSTDAQ